jgi:hypothetical protein
MNATLEQIYARHDRKVLLERIFVNGSNQEGHNQYTGKQEAFDAGFTQRDPSDIRQWNKEGISKSGLVSHLKEHGFKPGDSLVTPKGTAEFYESEQGIAYSWRPKKGRGHDAIAMFKSDAKDVKRHPIRYRNPTFHNQVAEITSSLASRIETLLARDSRPTYYAPNQPESHDAVRNRAEAVYKRAVDRSVDYAAAKAAQLAADRKAEAKKKAAIEEEVILLFLMLMADAGEEAYETSTVGLEGVLGEEPEVVPPAVLKEFVEQRRAVLSGFPVEMSQRLTRIVTDGIERGQTDREIRSRIGLEASAIKKGQGSVVSLTEAQATYGGAQTRLLQRAGFETCLWVTQGDEKVRQSHRECEEAGEITIGHEFPNGLRFPGDPQGPASEVCGCRCNLIGGRRKSGIQATAHDVSEEKRDKHGRWSEGPGDITSHGTVSWTQDQINDIAKECRVNSDCRIRLTEESYPVKIGDWSFEAVGSYDRTAKTINLFKPVGGMSRKQMLHIIGHEYAHHEFDSVMNEFRRQEELAIKDPEDPMYPSGEIREEFLGRYPILALVSKIWRGTGYDKLEKDDGVTPYSKSWWEKYRAGQTSGWGVDSGLAGVFVPMNETYAEVRALKYSDPEAYTSSVSSTWKAFAKAIETAAKELREK